MLKRFVRINLYLFLLAPGLAVGVQKASTPSSPPATSASSQLAFVRAADQVLTEMSQIVGLSILHPLKKSLRSKEQIRAFLVHQDKEDKRPEKRQADRMALEAFGLIPHGFNLNGFMLDLLTEQIAGYYDSKAKEFYIADWIPLSDQREVMAHELTHALQDQHFHIDHWMKAARPNDDAETAREAVLEGSATVAMLDFELRGLDTNVRALPDLSTLIQLAMGTAASSPGLAKAPPYIRDALLFPYLNGAIFTQRLLKAGNGWPDFYKVFSRPPISTQQVMQPAVYLLDKAPPPIELPDLGHLLGKHWKLLDENVIGEFGLQEVLRRYLPEAQVSALTPDWWGDRYAILVSKQSKSALLVFRLCLDSPTHAEEFFKAYSALLRKKHADATRIFAAPDYLQFATASDQGVFFECRSAECVSMEGGDGEAFDRLAGAMKWPGAPQTLADSSSREARQRGARGGWHAHPPTAMSQ